VLILVVLLGLRILSVLSFYLLFTFSICFFMTECLIKWFAGALFIYFSLSWSN